MTHATTVCACPREARMSSAAYKCKSQGCVGRSPGRRLQPWQVARAGLRIMAALMLLATLAGRATADTITTVAGNGLQGSSGDGGSATSASLNSPLGVALDSYGNFFIADSSNNRIRRVDAGTGLITTVAGTGVKGLSGAPSGNTCATPVHPHPSGAGRLEAMGCVYSPSRQREHP